MGKATGVRALREPEEGAAMNPQLLPPRPAPEQASAAGGDRAGEVPGIAAGLPVSRSQFPFKCDTSDLSVFGYLLWRLWGSGLRVTSTGDWLGTAFRIL